MGRLRLQSSALHNNAHTHFARMRRETPVYRARFSLSRDVYFITRYADVEALLKGDQLVKEPANSVKGPQATRVMWVPKMVEPLLNSMLTTDDPNHRRLRNIVAKAFTPRVVADLKPVMEEVAQRLVSSLATQRTVDLIQAFALPFPVHIITEMVGVPAADRETFQRWVHAIVRPAGPISMVRMLAAIRSFMGYVRRLANTRRKHPGNDMLSGLVMAEEGGERLSDDEIVAMCFLLLTAGHETTVSLIANGMLALLTHPEQLERLRANPDLMGSAVEELLRFDGPLLGTELYYAREAFTLRGVTIPAAAAVLPMVLSANRDEDVFIAPETLDITRTPNKHLAFGKGVHHCLGAPLARLQGQVAFSTLLRTIPNLRLAVPPERVRYRSAMFLHRLEALPVHVV